MLLCVTRIVLRCEAPEMVPEDELEGIGAPLCVGET